MLGKYRGLPRPREARRLQFEPARKLNNTMVDHNLRRFKLFFVASMRCLQTALLRTLCCLTGTVLLTAANANRLNLLYESHPAGTQVDGLPRAASITNEFKLVQLFQNQTFPPRKYT